MKNSIYWISVLIIFGLLNSTCHDKDDGCICKDNEVCIYDTYIGKNECYLSESVHYLGGERVIAPNSYLGIISNSQCVDTLIFYNDTTRALDDERFGLIVNVPPGVQDVIGSTIPYQANENEFYSSSVIPLCYLNGIGWYSNLHFFIYPDSIWMELDFWTIESDPGEIIDSVQVVFYKKQ